MPPLEGEVVERQRNRRGLSVNRAVKTPLRLAKSRLRRLLACIAPAGAKVSPFGLPAFNSGMIAPGNHNFEKFAALCNTLSGAPRALRPEYQ